MGAGASTLPPVIDKAAAEAFAGDKFDAEKWAPTEDGTMSRDDFLKAAGIEQAAPAEPAAAGPTAAEPTAAEPAPA